MLLTLTTTHRPATDLGYLLRKHPDRIQEFRLSFGRAQVFYPEASEERATAALLIEVDPVALVRGPGGPAGEGGQFDQYVNDRPYAASSFLSVALSQVFRSAMTGQCAERPDLANLPMPLVAGLSALPCRGGEAFLRRLFEPLGYRVTARRIPLDDRFPEWGEGRHFQVELESERPLHEFLSHLYVLVPVLDGDKHYWIGDAEVEKLLRHGEGWLAEHPEKEAIARRYLKHRRSLVDEALSRLVGPEASEEESDGSEGDVPEDTAVPGRRPDLHEVRLQAVAEVLRDSGATRVLDLGCGEGRLLRRLVEERRFTEIVGVDVSHRALQLAADRLRLDRLPEAARNRIRLLHGSLTYRDARLAGFDAAAVVEVVEHLDPPRLEAFEQVVFGCARPGTVVMTTPNREYNVLFGSMPPDRLRHRDHRFEWTRAEFRAWSDRVADAYGYSVRTVPLGPEDAAVGAPSQMAVFARRPDASSRTRRPASPGTEEVSEP